MKEEFFEKNQKESGVPEKKAESCQKVELPENVRAAIRGEGKEYNTLSNDGNERRLRSIEEWLSTASTEEELEKMFDIISEKSSELILDDGAWAFEAELLRDLLMRHLLKNRKEEIEG